jgi:hypothetical protein
MKAMAQWTAKPENLLFASRFKPQLPDDLINFDVVAKRSEEIIGVKSHNSTSSQLIFHIEKGSYTQLTPLDFQLGENRFKWGSA